MFHRPPLSHWASLSQTESGAALAVPAIASGVPTTTAPATARRRRLRPVLCAGREVILGFLLSHRRGGCARQRGRERPGERSWSVLPTPWGGATNCDLGPVPSFHLDGPEPRDRAWRDGSGCISGRPLGTTGRRRY